MKPELRTRKSGPTRTAVAALRKPEAEDFMLPKRVLKDFSRAFPRFFEEVAAVRAETRGGGEDFWNWCYAPSALTTSVMREYPDGSLKSELVGEYVLVDQTLGAALAAWRLTKGVYAFDPTLLESLWSSGSADDIPRDVLKRMPEWCVFILTPGLLLDFRATKLECLGYFAWVDCKGAPYDSSLMRLCFELLVDPHVGDSSMLLAGASPRLAPALLQHLRGQDTSAGASQFEYLHMPIVLDLSQSSVRACIEEKTARARTDIQGKERKRLLEEVGAEDLDGPELGLAIKLHLLSSDVDEDPCDAKAINDACGQVVASLLAPLLYLCSDDRDIRSAGGQVNRASPAERDRAGKALLAADCVAKWEVGYRIGAALRLAQEESTSGAPVGSGASVRPHIRRAHWHTFLAGPKDSERERRIKWLPPIPVKVESPDDLVPTVRKVTVATRHARTDPAATLSAG